MHNDAAIVCETEDQRRTFLFMYNMSVGVHINFEKKKWHNRLTRIGSRDSREIGFQIKLKLLENDSVNPVQFTGKAQRPLYVTRLAHSWHTFLTHILHIPCTNVIKEIIGWNIVM